MLIIDINFKLRGGGTNHKWINKRIRINQNQIVIEGTIVNQISEWSFNVQMKDKSIQTIELLPQNISINREKENAWYFIETQNETTLKIVTKNTNGQLTNRLEELINVTQNNNVDFLMLQETKLIEGSHTSKIANIENFNIIWNNLDENTSINEYVKRKTEKINKQSLEPTIKQETIKLINPKPSASKGTAIIYNKKWEPFIDKIIKDESEQRGYIILRLKLKNENIIIANIYAPAKSNKQTKRIFFKKLWTTIKTIQNKENTRTIITGDLNISLNRNDQK